MKRVLKVYRAERFSPNSVDKDRAIIDATGLLLSERGFTVTGINENDLDKSSEADIRCLSAECRTQREEQGCSEGRNE